MSRLPIKQQRFFRLWGPFLLVAATVLAYGNTVPGDFVWDDRALFVEHEDQWRWTHLKSLLTAQDNLFEDRYTGYYRPFPNLTFLVDHTVWGCNPAGYHVTNLLFHALTTLGIYWLARLLFTNPWVALLSALCFSWHPINTESVAWINGRNNVLCACFFVWSIYFFLKSSKEETARLRNCSLSLAAFLLSLFSKEYALMLPATIFSYVWAFSPSDLKVRCREATAKTAPYLLLIIIYLVVRSMVLPGHGPKFMHWETLGMRLLTVPKTFALYLRLLVAPVHLTVHYETTLIKTVRDPSLWLCLGVTVAYTALLVAAFRRSRQVFWALLWILITLVPVLNIIPLSDDNRFMAERYLYLPAVGFCLALGPGLRRLWEAITLRVDRLSWAAAVLGVGLLLQWYLFGTLNRNLAWRNEVALWTDAVSYHPTWYHPYFNLAVALRDAGRFKAAVEMFKEAYHKAQTPEDRGLVLSNIALVAYRHQKDYETARKRLQQARQLIPNKSWVYNLMGNVSFVRNEYDQALTQYDQALSLDPHDTESMIAKGMTYFKMGRIDETIQYLEEVRAIVPDDGRLDYYLGRAYDRKGLTAEAVAHYVRYLKRLPEDMNRYAIEERLKKIGAVPPVAKRPQ
ncbi:MAG: tetratricopeptide repeat protein [Deltaproteobacteria bacterium]|nr:tetratricopeptide repeat protein [Deltaproteobacteria bacterium]